MIPVAHVNLLPIPVRATNRVQIPFDEAHPLKKSTFKLFFGLQHYQGSFPNTPLSVSRRRKKKKIVSRIPVDSRKAMYFPRREITVEYGKVLKNTEEHGKIL